MCGNHLWSSLKFQPSPGYRIWPKGKHTARESGAHFRVRSVSADHEGANQERPLDVNTLRL